MPLFLFCKVIFRLSESPEGLSNGVCRNWIESFWFGVGKQKLCFEPAFLLIGQQEVFAQLFRLPVVLRDHHTNKQVLEEITSKQHPTNKKVPVVQSNAEWWMQLLGEVSSFGLDSLLHEGVRSQIGRNDEHLAEGLDESIKVLSEQVPGASVVFTVVYVRDVHETRVKVRVDLAHIAVVQLALEEVDEYDPKNRVY